MTRLKKDADEHNKAVKKAEKDRKKKARAAANAKTAEQVNAEKSAEKKELALTEKQLAKEIATLSGGRVFERGGVAKEIQFTAGEVIHRKIHAGKLLLWGKLELGHGEFEKWRAEEVGISKGDAHACMAFAKRAPILKAARLMEITVGNVKELQQEITEEEWAELQEIGEVRGIAAEKIQGMTRKELARALRKKDTKLDERDAALAERDKIIAEQETEIMRLKLGSYDEQEIAARMGDWQADFRLGINWLYRLSNDISEQAQSDIAAGLEWLSYRTLQAEAYFGAKFPDADNYSGPDRDMILEKRELLGKTGKDFSEAEIIEDSFEEDGDGEPEEPPESPES